MGKRQNIKDRKGSKAFDSAKVEDNGAISPAGSDKRKAKAKVPVSPPVSSGVSCKRKGPSDSDDKRKGKEEARQSARQPAQDVVSDLWQVDQWTWQTVQEAYKRLDEDPTYHMHHLCTKQHKAKFANLKSFIEERNHLPEQERLSRAKTILKELPQQGYPCPISVDEAKKHSDEEVKRRGDVESVLQRMREEFTPQQTKRMVILRENKKDRPIHHLDKAGSTVTRIVENFKSKPNSPEPSKAEKAITAMQENPNHYLARIRRGDTKKMFFYGTSEGQRMHVQAARWAELEDNLSAGVLEARVIRDMKEGEKETWREVSNYWLAGSIETQLGMVGERAHGLGMRNGRDYFEARLREEMGRRSESDLYVNLGEDAPREEKGKEAKEQAKTEGERQQEAEGEKALFLSNFREAQNILGKDWVEDVKRPEYQDKPGKKTEQAPASQSISGAVGGSASGSASGSSSGLSSESSSNKTPEQHYDDLICRRMCKWILHLAAYNKQPVIYALDTIDLGASAEAKLMKIPDNVSGTGTKLKIPVCTSELREAFRYIDKLTNVEFYEELIPVDKPWGPSRDPSLQKSWAEYALHLTRKMLLLYPGDQLCLQRAEAMLAAWDQGNWAQVIACYAAIKPSELLTPVFPVTKHQLTNHNMRIEQMEKSVQSMDIETAEKYRTTAVHIQHKMRLSVVPELICEFQPADDLNVAGAPNHYAFFAASDPDHSAQSQEDAVQAASIRNGKE